MNKILLVGLGGAIGAILRYGLSFLPIKMNFPVATFLTNVIGALLIGIVVGLFEKSRISSDMTLFLKTGVCGGFTTFSTFSLESLQLFENGQYMIGTIYMIVSIVGCLLGVYIGRFISMR